MSSMDDPSIWSMWSITPERMVRWRSVKSLWNCLDEGCLLMPSLDYLMADRGIHAEEHAETETEGTMACFTQETTLSFPYFEPTLIIYDIYPKVLLLLEKHIEFSKLERYLFSILRTISANLFGLFNSTCLLLRLLLCSADIGQFVKVALPSIFSTLDGNIVHNSFGGSG